MSKYLFLNKLRYILFPFSIVYALITEFRNLLYDKKILKSVSFDVPIINVGNLSVGGTGKTPQIEYLIRLLQNDYKIAVISRGYKRKSKGIIIADEQATAEQIGDEPYQIHQKFPNVLVAVGSSRVAVVRKVLAKNDIDVILLDDAFQHRHIKAGLNIILTPFQQLFSNDFVLPAGNLRECRRQAKHADIVLVTKSPDDINLKQKEPVIQSLRKYFEKTIFFASIDYQDEILSDKNAISLLKLKDYDVLLITGIANPKPLYSFLSEKNINFVSLKYGDHHSFSATDIQQINKQYQQLQSNDKIVLTTEKDYVRLRHLVNLPLYYLPISTKVFENEMFNNKILDYVRKDK